MCDHGHAPGHSHGHSHGPHAHGGGEQSNPAAAASAPATHPLQAAGDADDLPSLFARGQALHRHLEAGCSGGDGHSPAAHISEALSCFLRCAARVRADGILSGVDALEDVATDDLPYLLVEWYIATLRQQDPGCGAADATSARGRHSALTAAASGLEAFLARCVSLGVVSRSERRALGLPADSDEERGGGSRPRVLPEAARAAKVERYRRAAAAKKRLQELETARARLPADGGEGATRSAGGSGGGGGAPDADTRRELAVLALTAAVLQAVDDLGAIAQELPLLAHRVATAAAQAGAGSGPARERDDARVRQRGPPPDDLAVDPSRPGLTVMHVDSTFKATREVVRADVFQYRWPHDRSTLSGLPSLTPLSFFSFVGALSHILPSVGLEEWGDTVMHKLSEREAREAEQEKGRVWSEREVVEKGLEDDEAKWDAATVKRRNFDDWADGVPKGTGVTKRV